MVIDYQLDDIEKAAEALLRFDVNNKVFTFSGELGAGKTTLVKSICKILGVSGMVSSATFPIINEYALGDQPFYHIDLYRLRDEREVIQAGVEECLLSGCYCFVEWPERAPYLYPKASIAVQLLTTSATSRRMSISTVGLIIH